MKQVKDIVVSLKKEDGSVKKYTRPATNIIEFEKFQEMQEELRKSYKVFDELESAKKTEKVDSIKDIQKRMEKIDFGKIKRENQNKQIEFIVELFKPHDAFTVEEFKLGTPSFLFSETLVDIFRQISPDDFPKEDNSEKKSRSKNLKRT